MRLLLDKCADIESKNRSGQTLMLWSAQKGYVTVLQLLVDKGANIKSRDVLGPNYLFLSSHSQIGKEDDTRCRERSQPGSYD